MTTLPIGIKIVLEHPNAKVPCYGKPGDAGADLFLTSDAVITDSPQVVSFGISIEMPMYMEGQVRPRSSSSKAGLHVCIGTIDSGYRGPIGATVWMTADWWGCNTLRPRLRLKAGDRIAQIVFSPVLTAKFETAETLGESVRGVGSFGSTGR